MFGKNKTLIIFRFDFRKMCYGPMVQCNLLKNVSTVAKLHSLYRILDPPLRYSSSPNVTHVKIKKDHKGLKKT